MNYKKFHLTISDKIENASNEVEFWATQDRLVDFASDEAKYWVTQKKLVRPLTLWLF